MALFLCVYFVV